MDKTVKTVGVVFFVLIPVMLSATYAPRELFMIPWGDGTNQIKMIAPVIDGIPSDTTDYNIEPGDGPSNIFVDSDGNLVVLSQTLKQLKVFSNTGELLFNLWPPEGNLDPELFHGYPSSLYIDSVQHIYLAVSPSLNYVPVVNYEGQLINRLYPFDDTLTEIEDICWSSLNRAAFYSLNGKDVTFSNNEITSGGTCAFMAADSCYYSCVCDGEPYILFFRNHIQDMKHHIFTSDSIVVEFPQDTIFSAKIIFGGDGSYLFIYLIRWSFETKNIHDEIYIYDLNFRKIVSVELAPPSITYDYIIKPFVTRDNSIYEYRALDDGLHVIKWTKK
jgi:hypothetical protein